MGDMKFEKLFLFISNRDSDLLWVIVFLENVQAHSKNIPAKFELIKSNLFNHIESKDDPLGYQNTEDREDDPSINIITIE